MTGNSAGAGVVLSVCVCVCVSVVVTAVVARLLGTNDFANGGERVGGFGEGENVSDYMIPPPVIMDILLYVSH